MGIYRKKEREWTEITKEESNVCGVGREWKGTGKGKGKGKGKCGIL